MEIALIFKNWKKILAFLPEEDSYMLDIEEKIYSVADGVTRDPCNYLPNINTFIGKIIFSLKYPRPSPAKKAADIFTETFLEVLKDYKKQNRDEKVIREAFEEANKRIKYWNEKNILNPDYLTKDFAGCTAAGTSIYEERVSLGFIGDCGVAIFNEKGELKFRTENDVSKYEKERWNEKKLKGKKWEDPETRKIMRSYYRNNPKEKYSYGVLTGQQEAMNYVKTYTKEIKLTDYLVVYSDGLENIIFEEEFSNKLREKDKKGLIKLCNKVKTEGTLICYSLF